MKNTSVLLGDGTDLVVEIGKKADAATTYNKTEVNELVNTETTFVNPDGFGPGDGTTNAVGALPKGTVVNNTNLVEVVQKMLFVFQKPAFTSFSLSGVSTTLECGASIPAALTFTWGASNVNNIQAGSIVIRDVSANEEIVSGLNYSPTSYSTNRAVVTKNAPGSQTYSISGTDTDTPPAAMSAKKLTISWVWKNWILIDNYDAANNPTAEEISSGTYITNAQIKAGTGKLGNMTNGTKISFPAGSRRMVIAIPPSQGAMKSITSANLNLNVLGSFVQGTLAGLTGATDDAAATYKLYVFQSAIPTPTDDTYTIAF